MTSQVPILPLLHNPRCVGEEDGSSQPGSRAAPQGSLTSRPGRSYSPQEAIAAATARLRKRTADPWLPALAEHRSGGRETVAHIPTPPSDYQLVAKRSAVAPARIQTSIKALRRSHGPLSIGAPGITPANYIAVRLAVLRDDEAAFDEFRGSAEALEKDRRRERQERFEVLQDRFAASTAPIDPEKTRERSEEKRAKVIQTRHNIAEAQMIRRRAVVERVGNRAARSENLRQHLRDLKPLAKQWSVFIAIAASLDAFVQARRAGYRRRWVHLIVVYGARHWHRRTERRRDQFDRLRLNFFIRRNLPRVVESFRVRRCLRALPRVKEFLQQYTHLMVFVFAVRTFRRRVIQVQRIVRARQLAMALQLASARAGFDREQQRLLDGQLLLVDVPPNLRDVILKRVLAASASAYRKANDALLARWKQSKEQHEPLLQRYAAQVGAARANGYRPLLDLLRTTDGGSSRVAFMERQFAASRAFFAKAVMGRIAVAAANARGTRKPGASPRRSSVFGGLRANGAEELHPSMRFGAARRARMAAVAAAAAGSGGRDVRRQSMLPPAHGAAELGTVAVGKGNPRTTTHDIIAASKSRLASTATPSQPHQGFNVSAPNGREAQGPVTVRPHVGPLSSTGRYATNGKIRQRILHHVNPADVAALGPVFVDLAYLLNPPPAPIRKVFCHRKVMERLVRLARDAVFAAIRRFREEYPPHGGIDSPLRGLDEGGGGGGSASFGPLSRRESVSLHLLDPELLDARRSSRILTTSVRLGRSVKPSAGDFSVPDALNTTDEAFLARYLDLTWIKQFVASVRPQHDGEHATEPRRMSFVNRPRP